MAKIVNFSTGKRETPPPERNKEEGREHAREARKQKKQSRSKVKRLLGRFLAALFTLVLIVGAVLAVVFRDELNIDSLRRYLAYQSLERDESGQAEEIFFDSNATNCFAQVDNSLLVCSNTGIRLFSQSGTEYINETIAISSPAVAADGAYAVVFDVGGNNLYQITGKAIASTRTTDGPIFNARVNSNGYMTVTTQETGYKGVVTVYDARNNARVRVNISSAYVMDAAVSGDGDVLAVVTVGEEENSFCSTVTFYDTGTGEVQNSWQLPDHLVVDLKWQEGQVWLQTDQGAVCVEPEQGILGSWENGGGYLWGYAFCSGGNHVSAWGKYETGNQGQMVLVNQKGEVTAQVDIFQRILSLSVAGDYTAVLYTNKLEIYNSNLELYAELEDTAGARRVLMRSDGSALLVGSESASLYVP